MFNLTKVFAIICTMGLLAAGPVSGHHAATAQFDPDQQVEREGVLVKVEWLNPHAYFYIDVTDDETGEVTTWACELGSPASLMRRGWSKDDLQLGQILRVEGDMARDGSSSMHANTVVEVSSDRELFTR